MMDISTLELDLDLVELLDHWGVDTYDLHEIGNMSWRSSCFIHLGDNDSSLSIKYVKGRYWMQCYSHNCFNSSLVDYGLSIGKSFTDVIRDYEMCQGKVKRSRNAMSNTAAQQLTLPDNVMDRYENAIHKSYIDLGFDRDILLTVFSVRYCNDINDPMFARVVYPIRDKFGTVKSIQGRRTSACGEGAAKYMFMPQTFAKDILYGQYEMKQLIRSSRYIVVTESPKSVMRGYQLGIATLGLMGIRYTPQQVKQLASYGKKLILIADNDTPGIDGMVELERELSRYVPVEFRICPDDGADISDYRSRDEWMKIIGRVM